MEKPALFSVNHFDYSLDNLTTLEKDETQILHIYDLWESYLHFIKDNNKKWKNDKNALDSIKIISDLENLWVKYRKQISSLKNEEYEPISLIQYRMMLFVKKRRELRHKSPQSDVSMNENKINETESPKLLGKKELKQATITNFMKK